MSEYEEDVADDGFCSDGDLKRISELANRQLELEQSMLNLASRYEELKKAHKLISTDTLPNLMIEIGMGDFKLLDGSQVELKDSLNASIKKDDEPKAFTWLRENDEKDIIKNTIKASLGMEEDDKIEKIAEFMIEQEIDCEIKPSIHPGTLKKFVKLKLEEGIKLPEFFSVFEYKETKIKKPKNK